MKNGLIAGSLLVSISLMVATAQEEKEYVLAEKETNLPVETPYLQVYKTRMPNSRIEMETDEFNAVGKMNYLAEEERLVVSPEIGKVRMTSRKMSREREVAYEGQEPIKSNEPHEMEGKTLLLEKKDGKWDGLIEGGKALEDENAEVVAVVERILLWVNSDGDFRRYGIAPRKVGDKWEADPASHPMMAAFKVSGGSYHLHFKEVKEFLGEPCAVIEARFSIKGVGRVGTEKGVHLTSTGTSRTIRSLKTFLDYKYTESNDYLMEGPIERGGLMKMNGKLKLEARMIPRPDGE